MKNKVLFKFAAAAVAVMMCMPILGGCGDKKEDTEKSEGYESQEVSSKFDADNDTTVKATADATANEATASAAAAAEAIKATAIPTETSVSQSSKVQSMLDDAQSFVDAGMVDDAREMLKSIDPATLTAEQSAVYDAIEAGIAAETDTEESESESFTAQDAVAAAEAKYGITLSGDVSGLTAETDIDGRKYYRMIVNVESENQTKEIKVYYDGIEEVSSTPISYG